MWDDCEELSEAFDDSTSGHEQRDLEHHSPPMYAQVSQIALNSIFLRFYGLSSLSFLNFTGHCLNW